VWPEEQDWADAKVVIGDAILASFERHSDNGFSAKNQLNLKKT